MTRRGSTEMTYAKPDDSGSSNPDPTMRKMPGSPKGENMPPAGGESMAPADTKHEPGATQKQIKQDEK